jgi:hypothetical protein
VGLMERDQGKSITPPMTRGTSRWAAPAAGQQERSASESVAVRTEDRGLAFCYISRRRTLKSCSTPSSDFAD